MALAMQAIRDVNPAARLIQTEDCGRVLRHAADATPGRVREPPPVADVGSADRPRRCAPSAAALSGRCRRDRRASSIASARSPRRPSVIGLNYYLTSDRFLDHRLDRYPAELHGGNGRIRYADVEAVRARRRGIAGHRAHLLRGVAALSACRWPSPRCTSAAPAKSRCAGCAKPGEARARPRARRRPRRGRHAVGAARIVRLGFARHRSRAATTNPAPSTSARRSRGRPRSRR